jgi:hypothetical protein
MSRFADESRRPQPVRLDWLAPSLMLIAGVSLVAETYSWGPSGWNLLWRIVGYLLLLAVPPAVISAVEARAWTRRQLERDQDADMRGRW